ncbi:MAG: sugar phosphate isomerase/epimerase [Treponema sp.]|jgi:sugar phosphate isomerase/epimerase|nr:sugar phosphate isomerase/epimerase [Treponema sp.]
MRIGLCTAPENLNLAGRLGFDYVEWALAAVESLQDGEFAALLAKVKESPVKPERFNVLFPGSLKLVGPESDPEKIKAYLRRAFDRAAALGGKIVVFGSGRCRAFPAGMVFKKGYGELVKVTRLIGEEAAKYGITIAIEPLNRDETNCINSVKEGAMLEADAGLPSVGLLADLYHVLKEREPLEDIVLAGDLKHTHVALLEGRSFPVAASPELKGFFGALKKIGYSGTMSIEGNTENPEADAAASLRVLRSLADEAV